jgi:hypothetical protein
MSFQKLADQPSFSAVFEHGSYYRRITAGSSFHRAPLGLHCKNTPTLAADHDECRRAHRVTTPGERRGVMPELIARKPVLLSVTPISTSSGVKR